MLPAADAGDESARAARDKSVAWFASTKSDDDAQSLALRLLLWSRLARPADEIHALVDQVRQRQDTDGGWRQAADMAGDAWATGQALYALASAGVAPSDPALVRGREFLIRTQREDGSWPMKSRPMKPDGQGSQSRIPITGGGSAWAVLGLVPSS